MSLFPGHLKPGGTVTLHLRWQVDRPGWARTVASVVDPHGEATRCLDRLQLLLPPKPRSEDDDSALKDTGEIVQATPLLMAAHFLRGRAGDADHFVRALGGLRDSTHGYLTYRLPADAPLGRYRVALQVSFNGQTTTSGTAATDHFFVEDLRLEKVGGVGKQREAHVENRSPESVSATLCEYDPDSGTLETRVVRLPAKSVSALPFQGIGFLSYIEGTELLRFSEDNDPFCARNPNMPCLRRSDGTLFAFRTLEEPESGYRLHGEAAKVWHLADGFRPRSLVRNDRNAAIYDDLVLDGLILEIA
jgi:hypothetical protein